MSDSETSERGEYSYDEIVSDDESVPETQSVTTEQLSDDTESDEEVAPKNDIDVDTSSDDEIIDSDEESGDEHIEETKLDKTTRPIADHPAIKLQDKVITKRVIVLNPADYRTSNVMSRPEITDIKSIRAQHIANGAPVFTDVIGLTDPISMAKKELIDGKCPLILDRMISKGENSVTGEIWEFHEYWDPNLMVKENI